MFGLDIMTYEDQAGCGPFLGLVKKQSGECILTGMDLFYVAMTRVFHFFWPYSYKKAVSLLAFTTCCNYAIKRGILMT